MVCGIGGLMIGNRVEMILGGRRVKEIDDRMVGWGWRCNFSR